MIPSPTIWPIFTEEPSYSNSPTEGPNHPLFQPFESIKGKLTDLSAYDESIDVSSTYLSSAKDDNKSNFQLELKYNFDPKSFTTCSYLSKSFFDSNVYLHKFPKIKPRASRIYMGNGEWVPTLFIIPLAFSIDNLAFKVYTSICLMAYLDFIWGMKNIVETEGQLCTWTMKYKFLNRSPKIYPIKPFTLPPDGLEPSIELKIVFPSEIGGHAVAKFILSPSHLLKTTKRTKMMMWMNNYTRDKIEAIPDTLIGILEVRSLGFFILAWSILRKAI